MTKSVSHEEPFNRFAEWLAKAEKSGEHEANAMNLATASPEGRPSNRMVLLKGHDVDGFVFYTNYEGRKGQELLANPFASLCFHWKGLKRQIRIEGAVETVGDEEADAYFNSRALNSRIGAWASQQSRPLDSKTKFLADVAAVTAKFAGKEITRPPYWSGFRLVPDCIEFWEDGAFRLHNRDQYKKTVTGWTIDLLYP